jgi:hypothetical protein
LLSFKLIGFEVKNKYKNFILNYSIFFGQINIQNLPPILFFVILLMLAFITGRSDLRKLEKNTKKYK